MQMTSGTLHNIDYGKMCIRKQSTMQNSQPVISNQLSLLPPHNKLVVVLCIRADGKIGNRSWNACRYHIPLTVLGTTHVIGR